MTGDGPVVVGVDGSPDGEAALRWAADMAETMGSALEIVTVWDWPRSYGWVVPVPSGYDPGADAARLADAAEATVRADHPEMRCAGTVVQGAAAAALCDASKAARLLVVGSRGHGELAGMLIGSVSQYCVAHAHCPVVVVRREHAGDGEARDQAPATADDQEGAAAP